VFKLFKQKQKKMGNICHKTPTHQSRKSFNYENEG